MRFTQVAIKALILSMVCCLSFVACKHKADEKIAPPPLIKNDGSVAAPGTKPMKAPIINIVDSMEHAQIIICIKDSSATSAGMTTKLNTIYNTKLPAFLKTSKLRIIGPPVAWYKTQKAPFFFEAGLPVDKAPAKLSKGIYIKRTGRDSAFVAHFFGPNQLSNSAYEALNEYTKDRKKKRSAPAYEIYVNNPFDSTTRKNRDPYKQLTDIVYPYK